ncbi:tachykinin-like peptides receptor 86C [Cydia pomonella]|uniref:tachykinin-like peptides receptor 86C n=1 Tax=Cydia pomonella TaxID=82600 RepID=UPI002ADE6ECD|nr:tachykinin-like peptides receptor 86C [Cydia pomonella]
MVYCYYCICNLLWNTRVIGERIDAQCKIQEDRKRMIKMLIFVVSSFAAGWLPFHVYFLVEGFWPWVKLYKHSRIIYICLYWLAMLNSTLNPLIYFWFLPNFRRHFNQILTCFFRIFPGSHKRHGKVGINQLDRYDNSRAIAASRKNGLSNGTTMDTFVSHSQKPSLDALADGSVDDAQQICETDA